MKIFNKNSLVSIVTVTVMVVSLMLGFAGPMTAQAATAIDLGDAASFAVLAGAAVTNVPTSIITGDLGLSPAAGSFYDGGVTAAQVTGTIYAVGAGGPAGSVANATLLTSAKQALTDAMTNAAGQTPTIPVTANTTDSFAGIGTGTGGYTLAPGIYNSGSAMGISAASPLILDGGGDSNAVFIFQAGSSLTTAANSVVSLVNGASACRVYWQIGSSTGQFGTNSIFKGTVMSDQSITDAGGSNIVGRLMAFTGTVALNQTTIAVPTCTAATPTPVASNASATITVVKNVINNSGKTKIIADFPLFVNGTPVVSGVAKVFPAPASIYTVTEIYDHDAYKPTFSGDCDANGQLNLNPGENKFCIVTNNDIGTPVVVPPVPPLIDVVKVPSPLALPAGPGPVTYTYTLSNIGIVPVTDITMVGDSCSPIVRVSGDTNNDSKLDLNETWVHTCTKTISATHTNTVVTTGWANGVSAVDITSATIVVGAPVVPPLIHMTKSPNVYSLPVGGGSIIYTYIVTNPGTATLSDVSITSDKCTGVPGRVFGHPGDINKNDLLESSETWLFTCLSNITQTTTSTGTARGSANGLTARDLAVDTVTVGAQLSTTTPISLGFTTLATLNLNEGDTVSAAGSSDPDIYIANVWGYKRLFLNPAIFGFYGHLGGFASVKTVSPLTRSMLVTSSLFRNCETNDPKVYGVSVTGEDTGTLHWINTSGAQAVQDDPDFFKKVFCINNNEFNWYSQGSAYTSVNQVPAYSR